MLKSEILAIILLVAIVYTTAHNYEEARTYNRNPECAPSNLDRGIKCSAVGPTITVQGGLYADYGFHFTPLASAYYVARMADALGYQECCPTNKTFLRELDLTTPWSPFSGIGKGIAVDGACGLDRNILRRCTFPNDLYPFLCTGSEGTPRTLGERLDTLSYISVLQGSNLRWTLFIHCWNAKTPQNTHSRETATSFNVFSLDQVLSDADRALVIRELRKRGFNTKPSNIIEFDYSNNQCPENCNSKPRRCD